MVDGGGIPFRRLLAALEEAKYRLLNVRAGTPALLEVDDAAAGQQLSLRIFIWPLGSERERPRSRRALMRRPASTPLREGEEEGTLTLVLGYEPELDVFVAWQASAHPRPAQGSSIRAPFRLLKEAREAGIATGSQQARQAPSGYESLIAFRPDQLRAFLEWASRVEEPPEGFAGAALRLPDARRQTRWRRRMIRDRAEEKPAAAPARRPERMVSTGFATLKRAEPLAPHSQLKASSPYLYWFEVGEPDPLSIELIPEELPLDLLPERATLTVAIFGFDGELEIEPGADVGTLQVDEEGRVVVRRQVEGQNRDLPAASSRLYFPVRTPTGRSHARLRCNVYCAGVLIQSRLVTAGIAAEAEPDGPRLGLGSSVEYALSRSLHPMQLATIPRADLSLMVNGDATSHQIRAFADDTGGRPIFKRDVDLDPFALQGVIDHCRRGLRKISWGSEEDWRPPMVPRGEAPRDGREMAADLTELAIRGKAAFVEMIEPLAGGREERRRLMERIRRPTRIEIAASPSAFVPAALFYDHALAGGEDPAGFELCGQFLTAHEAGTLAECACFQGDCPNREKKTVVCPGGFWGYRHSIGWPVSRQDGDAIGVIPYEAAVRTAVACAGRLSEATGHKADLETLLGSLEDIVDVEALLRKLEEGREQVVYLFCHGGRSTGGAPYVEVDNGQGRVLTRSDLFDLDLEPGLSLVFLNGCRTTEVSPQKRFDLVEAFVDHGGALGVIGPEITVFEPAAAPFAVDFLRSFVVENAPIGASVRRARIEALGRGSLAALAYVPFILGGTVLTPRNR